MARYYTHRTIGLTRLNVDGFHARQPPAAYYRSQCCPKESLSSTPNVQQVPACDIHYTHRKLRGKSRDAHLGDLSTGR